MCSRSGRVETSAELDACAGSHSRTASKRRPTYVYCMEINNWPPYSSFDELSGVGSIMSVWAWAAAFGRQWRRPRSPAPRSTRFYSNMNTSDRGTSPMSYFYRDLGREDPHISSSLEIQSSALGSWWSARTNTARLCRRRSEVRPILVQRLGHSCSEWNGVAKKIISTIQVLKVNLVSVEDAPAHRWVPAPQIVVSMEDWVTLPWLLHNQVRTFRFAIPVSYAVTYLQRQLSGCLKV